MPVSELLGREHPALVHLPIAASLLLLLSLGLWCWRGDAWRPASRLLAWAACIGGCGAVASGLLWARSLELLPQGGFLPAAPGLLSTHETLAFAGILPGLAAILGVERRRPRAALAAALLWAALWGAAGHWGGRMVFPDATPSQLTPETPWATSASPKSS
jgi:uncharacterized membrane protein